MASAGDTGSSGKKSLDFEINLTPFIDLFSVLICFLLLTAVWIQIGSMDVKQAVGGQPNDEAPKQNPPSVWIKMEASGDLILNFKDVPRAAKIPATQKITAANGRADATALSEYIKTVKEKLPDLNMALILPVATSFYEDIIGVMDKLRGLGIKDLGVSPL